WGIVILNHESRDAPDYAEMRIIDATYSGIVILDHGYHDTKTPKNLNLKTVVGIVIPKPD
ncbi:hypothetical protein J1N35_007687, partial [Gossypium stocksii]